MGKDNVVNQSGSAPPPENLPPQELTKEQIPLAVMQVFCNNRPLRFMDNNTVWDQIQNPTSHGRYAEALTTLFMRNTPDATDRQISLLKSWFISSYQKKTKLTPTLFANENLQDEFRRFLIKSLHDKSRPSVYKIYTFVFLLSSTQEGRDKLSSLMFNVMPCSTGPASALLDLLSEMKDTQYVLDEDEVFRMYRNIGRHLLHAEKPDHSKYQILIKYLLSKLHIFPCKRVPSELFGGLVHLQSLGFDFICFYDLYHCIAKLIPYLKKEQLIIIQKSFPGADKNVSEKKLSFLTDIYLLIFKRTKLTGCGEYKSVYRLDKLPHRDASVKIISSNIDFTDVKPLMHDNRVMRFRSPYTSIDDLFHLANFDGVVAPLRAMRKLIPHQNEYVIKKLHEHMRYLLSIKASQCVPEWHLETIKNILELNQRLSDVELQEALSAVRKIYPHYPRIRLLAMSTFWKILNDTERKDVLKEFDTILTTDDRLYNAFAVALIPHLTNQRKLDLWLKYKNHRMNRRNYGGTQIYIHFEPAIEDRPEIIDVFLTHTDFNNSQMDEICELLVSRVDACVRWAALYTMNDQQAQQDMIHSNLLNALTHLKRFMSRLENPSKHLSSLNTILIEYSTIIPAKYKEDIINLFIQMNFLPPVQNPTFHPSAFCELNKLYVDTLIEFEKCLQDNVESTLSKPGVKYGQE